MKLELMNGQRVEVSQEEINKFITQILVQNPDWHHSGLLTQEEIWIYLKGEGTQSDLAKVAWYILIYEENLAFTAYLFDKADGEPERTKEFNMPALKKLRGLYQKVRESSQTGTDVSQMVNEMEHICLEIGAEPF